VNERSTFFQRAAWCLFDFANSAFPTLALTAFGAPYFASVLVGPRGVDLGPLHLDGTGAWGMTISLSMLAVTLSSPVMGAVADQGRKRNLLAIYVGICVAATAALGLIPAGSGLLAMALYAIANFAFEGAYVFYNAFLPELVPPERIGQLSGAGWALGYVGGLGALALALPLLPSHYAAEDAAAGSRVYFLVAAWYAIFSLPTLVRLRDRKVEHRPIAVGAAFREVARTLRELRHDRAIALFLVAYLLYTDALDTTVHFTGIYTDEVLAFGPEDNVRLFMVLNVIAGPGALGFGFLVDRIGARRSIQIMLSLWCVVIVLAITATDRASFWPAAVVAAIVIGATQAASRSMMALLAPRERMAEMMGFLSLSGKASAIFGPLLYGAVAGAFADSGQPGRGHRIAIGIVGALFPIAMLVLAKVDPPRRGQGHSG
jgi:UMF1 family MFS transporter